nr:hypothetical protein [Nannocystis pusilla]
MDRLGQYFIKGVAAEADGQSHLLTLLRAPARAVHHPQEVGLDPRHPLEAERAAEALVLGGEPADRRAVGLIDDDRVGVELRQDVPASLRPAGFCR